MCFSPSQLQKDGFHQLRALLALKQFLKSLSLGKLKLLVTRHAQLFMTPWTVACQAPLSMGFSRQEYWSGLPFPSPRDHPDPGIKLRSPTLQADSSPSKLSGSLPRNDFNIRNK